MKDGTSGKAGGRAGGVPCNIWAFLHFVMKHNLLIPQQHRRKPLQENLAATEGRYTTGQENDKENSRVMNRGARRGGKHFNYATGLTKGKERGMTGRWASAPKRSSQHLAGDAFHFDREQLNPSTVGPREEKWRANKTQEEKQQSIQQSGPQMTRGPRPNESSRWHIRPQRSLF